MANKPKNNKPKNSRLQIPIREDLKNLAEEKAIEIGFSSVQDVVRLFLAGFVRNEYKVGFNAAVETVEKKKKRR